MSLLILVGCQKSGKMESDSWNALSFTENQEEQYSHYMDSPHLNLTYPSQVVGVPLHYRDGIFKYNNFNYVFVSHNWDMREAQLIVKEQAVEVKSYPVDVNSLKELRIELPPGNYSFHLQVKEGGEWKEFSIHQIAGNNNIEIR